MSSRFFIDISPLRKFPQFRLLWTGYALRQFGAQLTFVTVIYQTYQITHSNLDVGLLSLAQVIPATLVPLLGGVIVDAMDRRKLMMITAIGIGISTTTLAINAMGNHPALWVLFTMSAITWGLTGIDAPARTAANTTLVDRESITATTILRQVVSNTAQVAGPGVAGVLIAAFSHNIDIVYWIDVASSLWVIQTLLRMQPLLPVGGGRKFNVASVVEGFRFLKGRRIIQACYITDLNANILGLPIALFPYLALHHFHGGARTFGLLTASPAIGSVIASLLSGWVNRIRYQGRAVLISVSIWGFAIALFGLTPWLSVAVVLLAIAGGADSYSASLRNSIVQLSTPDNLRGQLSGISTSSVQAGKLGNLEAGIVASLSSAQISVISGGLGCVAGVLAIARFAPAYAKFQLHNQESTAAESAPPTP